MSTYEILSIAVTTAGFFAVILSLVFVVKQTKLVAHTLHANALGQLSSPLFEASRIFIEYPEQRKYFYDGVIPSEKDVEQAKAVALMILDIFDYFIVSEELLSKSYEPNKKRWDDWIIYMLKNSPFLRSVYSGNSEWYPDKLRELNKSALEGIDRCLRETMTNGCLQRTPRRAGGPFVTEGSVVTRRGAAEAKR